MEFGYSKETRNILARLRQFMGERVMPNESRYLGEVSEGDRWSPPEIVETLKGEARSMGLWNLFLPDISGLSNLQYAPLCEEMGRVHWSSEVFNCSAPDTGNMEILHLYGTPEQKERWLRPLLEGEMRSCFAMTEPGVASSDATNIKASIIRDGDHFVLNGRKWWSTGALDPRCRLLVFMGKTDEAATKYRQQSIVLVPMDSAGVEIVRELEVFGYDDAPYGHAEISFTDVRVPASNILLGEGRGFEIAQGRLGPGRIHHCMRLIGIAERSLEDMCERAKSREAFSRRLSKMGSVRQDIARSRTEIEQARLLVLKTAWKMDKYGNRNAKRDISMIKAVVPMMAQRVIDRAIQVFGAAGVSSDLPLARAWTIARTLRIADGPDEVHLESLAKLELDEVKRARAEKPSDGIGINAAGDA